MYTGYISLIFLKESKIQLSLANYGTTRFNYYSPQFIVLLFVIIFEKASRSLLLMRFLTTAPPTDRPTANATLIPSEELSDGLKTTLKNPRFTVFPLTRRLLKSRL